MKRLVIEAAIVFALAFVARAVADTPRWGEVSGLVMWKHATSGPVETSVSNPIPVSPQ